MHPINKRKLAERGRTYTHERDKGTVKKDTGSISPMA